MHDYKLFLKGAPEPVSIRADDVNMVSADGPSMGAYLNFWRTGAGGEWTVAAVPLEEVRYVLSE